jgi:predicted alpha/beta-fold hydrolase
MQRVRVPTLIVHAVDDPLAPAQAVADFIARDHNPRLAALMLPGGGHVGFAADAKQYYFSLIAAFFDPQSGASAAMSNPLAFRGPGAVRVAHHKP